MYQTPVVSIIALLLIAGGVSKSGCGPKNEKDGKFKFIRPAKSGPLIVWVKPGADADAFKGWKDSVENAYGKTMDTVKTCFDCNNNLMLLSGPAADTYVSQQTASGGNGSPGRTGAAGEDGDIIYSINIPVDIIDNIVPNDSIKPTASWQPRTGTKPPVTVAIFDTGIDTVPALWDLFYNNRIPSCLGPGSNNGWNFTAPRTSTRDDHSGKHGTAVSSFIANQTYQYGQNPVTILPVKTHASNGKSDLFSILCGLNYAVNRGAQVINASFGFYTPRYLEPSTVLDSSAFLFRKYIEYYLLPKNILLICAAGNRDDRNEDLVYRPSDRSHQRNLDSVSFYPASFARNFRNVIAVTTVNHSSVVADFQNFSPNVVDIGVYADRDSDFAFVNPIIPISSVKGSSFATPIVTGKICANYYLITEIINSGTYTKQQILDKLQHNGLAHLNLPLAGKIKNGLVMLK